MVDGGDGLEVNVRDFRFGAEEFLDLDLTDFDGTLVMTSSRGFSATVIQVFTNLGEFIFVPVAPLSLS